MDSGSLRLLEAYPFTELPGKKIYQGDHKNGFALTSIWEHGMGALTVHALLALRYLWVVLGGFLGRLLLHI